MDSKLFVHFYLSIDNKAFTIVASNFDVSKSLAATVNPAF